MNKAVTCFVLILCLVLGCKTEKYQQGRIIYETSCLNCHMSDGSGLGEMYPKLKGSRYLAEDIELLPCLIRQGAQSRQLETVYMPGHPEITTASMTNLINYMSDMWGDGRVVRLAEVTALMESCSK
ncbi:MAG: cytochrome c [Bacteroidota bacterium]